MNIIKKTIKNIFGIRIISGVIMVIFNLECRISRFWVASAHKRLFFLQWKLMNNPEHFDHHIDLYYQWLATRNPLWLERGVFGSLALKGGDVLELACGDGFNARNFYSIRSSKVLSCDFDSSALDTAKAKNSAENVEFVFADIRTDMPDGVYPNIIWDAAIEHFTPTEINNILVDIKKRLEKNGILTGYTLVEKEDGSKHIHQHEYEFKSKEDLFGLLTPHFENVSVFETVYPDRHNLYFWASDGVLPFSPNWDSCVSSYK